VHRLESSIFKQPLLDVIKELNIQIYVKRDDMSGGPELGGNKIRKLEFLLAEALEQQSDCVVTIGGEQSNHCRATACAARMVGLEPHLILRTKNIQGDHDLGLKGNLLFDRFVGSSIYTVTPGEYGRFGQEKIVDNVMNNLQQQGKKPYGIPVGGSNALGSWGYIHGVDELMTQITDNNIEHFVFACGSGGTLAGIVLGIHLYHLDKDHRSIPHCHAIGVCDSPEYFYNILNEIASDMGAELAEIRTLQENLTIHNGKGLGYAISTPEEMEFIQQFALDTGIVLDPVYSGKALYKFVTQIIPSDPERYRGTSFLFWHTGGALGMYDRDSTLMNSLSNVSKILKLDLYAKK